MQALRAAKRSLPDPSIMQIVAVSVDPNGDTPNIVKGFLRARELRPVWTAENIVAKSVPETPAIIEHASLIYGIDATGHIRVGYPASPISPKAIHGARRPHPRAGEGVSRRERLRSSLSFRERTT